MRRELLLFVPGLSATKAGAYTESLLENLENFIEVEGKLGTIKATSGATSDAPTTLSFTPLDASEPTWQYEFREVIWADLPWRLSALTAWRRFREGSLVLFFTIPLILSHVLMKTFYQVISVFGSALMFVFWYVGVVILVLDLLVELVVGTAAEGMVGGAVTWLKEASTPWAWLWAAISGLMLALPVSRVVDSASMMKQYLKNHDNLSERVVVRISKVLGEVRQRAYAAKARTAGSPSASGADEPAYDVVTVLAYSFGAVPAIESLSRFYRGGMADVPIRLVTLGAPLPMAVATRPEVERASKALAEQQILTKWYFLWSKRDWLSSDPADVRLDQNSNRFEQVEVNLGDGLWPVPYHEGYFASDELARILLETARASSDIRSAA